MWRFLNLFRHRLPEKIQTSPVGKHIASLSRASRQKAVALGIKKYKWLHSGADSCPVGLRYDGHIFRYDRPPPEGHPGEANCPEQWCRCVAASVFPGFD